MTRLAAVSLLSAAAIALEILLMRMFSIEQWHHFAYMIISVALLGYGASGTFLCFARERLLVRFPAAFAALVRLPTGTAWGAALDPTPGRRPPLPDSASGPHAVVPPG